jgi:putative inorganic carbon (hco3(-)) transporter
MRGGLAGAPMPAAGGAGEALRRAPGPRPDALLYVVLSVILTAVWRLHDLVPAVRALRPSIVLTAVGLALVAIDRDSARGLGRLRSPVTAWLGVLGALMVIGIPFGLNPDHSVRFFGNGIIPYIAVGFLVASSVRGVEDIEWLGLGTLVGACVYTGVMHASRGVDPLTGRWSELAFYDANDLALMLVSMLPLTLYFMRRGNSARRRVFAAACFVFFAYSVVKTGSRGGLVGLIAVLGYLVLGYRAIPIRVRLAGAAAAIMLLVAGGQAYRGRVGTVLRSGQDYNWVSETGRLAVWRRGVAYIKERPVLGLGVDGYRTAEREISPLARGRRMAGRGVPDLVAHNMFIHVAAELGLPALIAFVALLAAAARTLLRVRRHDGPRADDRLPAFAHALLASLVGFVVCGMFLSVAYFPYLQVLLGLTVIVGALTPAPARALRRALAARGAYGLAR